MQRVRTGWQATVDRHRAAVQGALGEEAFESAWAEGSTLSWSALMDEVTALSESAMATPPTLPARVALPRQRGQLHMHHSD